MKPKTDLEVMTEQILDFRDRRDWAQFHHPKELSSALAIEIAEIMELFRFKTADEVQIMLQEPSFHEKLGAELSDSLFLLLLLAHESKIDLKEAFHKKLAVLEERYPADQVRGKSDKWTAYQESKNDSSSV